MHVVRAGLWCLALSLGAAQAASAQEAGAQDQYPSRPIKILVPTSAGSALDVVARVVSKRMSETLGQPLYVENQPGASGVIALRAGARSDPDGYNITITNGSLITVIPNMKRVDYDPLNGFAPVSGLVKIAQGLISNPESGPKSVTELIARARQKPGAINYGTGGPGSPQHIAMELLARTAKIQLTHVPYRNVSGAISGVVSGEISVMFTAMSALPALVQANKVLLLGVTPPERVSQFKDVPTVAEAGAPGFSHVEWCAFLAPAGTPPAIVDKLNKATLEALADESVKAKLTGLGFTLAGSTPAELHSLMKQGFEDMRELVRTADIRE
jgi:tripartite-type tricarboxylate transporter receptor subunit TctC